ncbi:MAG: GC-type dockerin domain-anchored protein [Phycisphaerales bacterium JB060]
MRRTNPTRTNIRRLVGRAAASASCLFVAGHAAAQCEPSVAWRVQVPGLLEVEPAVGPDGEVAVQGLELVVIEPDGSVRFRRDLNRVRTRLRTDIAPDGTIYATALEGPVALDPDGRELWRAPLPDGETSHDPVAGPTIGPDGNIYYAGNLNVGLASLSPDGDLRWRTLPFQPRDSINVTKVFFADGKAIYADCCLGLGPGAVAIDMDDGGTEWFTRITGTQRLSQMTNGDIVLGQRPPGYTRIDPTDGGIIPTVPPFQPVTSWDVAPAADGIGYSVGSLQNLLRIPTKGDIEVVGRMPLAATAGGAMTPDDRTLVMGLAEDLLPSQAFIGGIDPQTAEVRWTIDLPEEDGWFLRVSGIPAITADGRRAYVPVFGGTRAGGNVSYLYAIDLCGAPCRADLDGDGELTLFDFLAFQNLFDAGDPIADFDGDGSLTIFDFLAFQNEFDAGCE